MEWPTLCPKCRGDEKVATLGPTTIPNVLHVTIVDLAGQTYHVESPQCVRVIQACPVCNGRGTVMAEITRAME